MRAHEFDQQASAKQILDYINSIQHDGFSNDMTRAVMKYPQWQLMIVNLADLHIPDQDFDDPDYEPPEDPYGRVMVVDPEHAGEYSANFVDQRPIVVDPNGFIIDGNHRAWAAAELSNRDTIKAWVPAGLKENFADGKVKGKSRPGRVKRAGASCKGSVTDLRAKARKYGGEKGKMYHWCANMKGGRKKVSEVNVDTAHDPDELTVKQTFIDYFTNKGYKMLGEGRDQIAFLTPRQTVLKVLGFGNEQREQAVEDYVEFFLQHQNNPYYPKIYNTQRFEYQGDSHFVYETEYLKYVANEEETLDWLETYMDLLARGGPEQAQQFVEEEGIPGELTLKDVQGLTQATQEIQENLAGYVVDLSNIENIRRRKNGHLVIVDPVSL